MDGMSNTSNEWVRLGQKASLHLSKNIKASFETAIKIQLAPPLSECRRRYYSPESVGWRNNLDYFLLTRRQRLSANLLSRIEVHDIGWLAGHGEVMLWRRNRRRNVHLSRWWWRWQYFPSLLRISLWPSESSGREGVAISSTRRGRNTTTGATGVAPTSPVSTSRIVEPAVVQSSGRISGVPLRRNFLTLVYVSAVSRPNR